MSYIRSQTVFVLLGQDKWVESEGEGGQMKDREGGIKQIPVPTVGWRVPRSLLESLHVVCRIVYPLYKKREIRLLKNVFGFLSSCQITCTVHGQLFSGCENVSAFFILFIFF